MNRPTDAKRGTQVEVRVQQPPRSRNGAIPGGYAVTVIPMGDDGRWWPHVTIVNRAGNFLKDAGSTAARFPTRAAALHAGWSFAEAWLRCRATR